MRLARTTPQRDRTTTVASIVVPHALPAAPGLEERFRAFYDSVFDRAITFAGHLADRMDAEEAVQDVMLAIWKSWLRSGPQPVTEPYLLAAIRHRIYRQRKARRDLVRLDDAALELDELAFRSHSVAVRDDPQGGTPGDVLDLALAAMPPKRRVSLLLAHVYEFTYKEAAAVMRVSEGTVKTHVRLGNADVRTAFEQSSFQYGTKRPAQLPAPGDAGETRDD